MINQDTEACPACRTSWVGSAIPEESRHNYGGSKHYSRLIAIYDMDKDRTVQFRCPDCGKEFPR